MPKHRYKYENTGNFPMALATGTAPIA